MKNVSHVAIAALLITVTAPYARSAKAKSSQYVQGTVVAVQKNRVSSPDYTMGGSNPSDAPLTSRYYEYEVSIRVGCMTYVGRYQTAFAYLPSVFSQDNQIRMRLTEHVMYFDLANDPDMRMGIVHRSSTCGVSRDRSAAGQRSRFQVMTAGRSVG